MRDEDELRETPPVVVGAVAVGTAPLPFLAVYAVTFIVHGGFHPVSPPDITRTAHGELVAGIIALALFVIAVAALLWMLNGRRRWPFAIVQLAVLGTAVYFLLDGTKGGAAISYLLVATSVAAFVCAFVPQAWDHVGRARPRRRRRRTMPAGSAPTPDTTPTAVRAVGRKGA